MSTQYTQNQIVKVIYFYMVEQRKADAICKHVLNMPENQIRKKGKAYLDIQKYYRHFGFEKRYKGVDYSCITMSALASYVARYWDKGANEKDLINCFPQLGPQIKAAIQKEKEDAAKPKSQTNGKKRTIKYRDEIEDLEYDEDDEEEYEEYKEEREPGEQRESYNIRSPFGYTPAGYRTPAEEEEIRKRQKKEQEERQKRQYNQREYGNPRPRIVEPSGTPHPIAGSIISGIFFLLICFVIIKLFFGWALNGMGVGYKLATFEKGDYQYVGNNTFFGAKKEGIRVNKKDYNDFAIGYLNGKKLKGYGIMPNGNKLVAGKYSGTNVKGWCVESNSEDGTMYFITMSGDKKKGYGILYDNGVVNIVDYGIGGEKIIATRTGSGWVTPKGKAVDYSEGYKKIKFDGDNAFTVGKIKVEFYPNNEFSYICDDVTINGSTRNIYYESNITKELAFCCTYNPNNGLVDVQQIDIERMYTTEAISGTIR